MRTAVLTLIAVLVAQPVLAELSVWQIAKQKTNSLEGRIKAIVVDEDEHKILLKVETAPDQVQTIKVCSLDVGNDFRTFEQSEKMALMRQAFARGEKVQVSFNGPFDRCLSSIQYSSNAKNGSGENI